MPSAAPSAPKASGTYPPNTLLMVDHLVKEPFLVEARIVAAL